MCFTQCMINGKCERIINLLDYNKTFYEFKQLEDGKILYTGAKRWQRHFLGDAEWEIKDQWTVRLIEHHNIEKKLLMMLLRHDRETWTIHEDIRIALSNLHIATTVISQRVKSLIKHGYLNKYKTWYEKMGTIIVPIAPQKYSNGGIFYKEHYALTIKGKKEARKLRAQMN